MPFRKVTVAHIMYHEPGGLFIRSDMDGFIRIFEHTGPASYPYAIECREVITDIANKFMTFRTKLSSDCEIILC